MLTLYDKVWNQHKVLDLPDGTTILYVDRHLIHEVTSPQAFAGLRLAGRKVRRPELTFATMDHNIPTDASRVIKDQISKAQIETLEKNCAESEITLFGLDSDKLGIVHVIGPELGITLPGTTIVCGDSHTSTHGAFGALAFGIGTSEVEHVLATQCLLQKKSKTFRVNFIGTPARGVTAKDFALKLIGEIGTNGGTGFVFEFAGPAIRALSMEGRMTLCNMSIEAGARAGMIAPDQTTIDYITGANRPYAPKGENLTKHISLWRELHSDEQAVFDASLNIDTARMSPQITWGTSPAMVIGIDEAIPEPNQAPHLNEEDARKALEYMGLKAGIKLTDVAIDVVFIGSCTNSRIEDLRAAASVLQGKKVKSSVQTLVVPGSEQVRVQAEREGLDKIFKNAGAEWRLPGCSMCLAMNPDKLTAGQRAASTSNRNFEGRQGAGGRTHLVGPEMAAAAAIAGHFVDIREL